MKLKTDFKSMLMRDAEWCNHLGFSDFDGLNQILRAGKAQQLVNLCEARHENACSSIAGDIVNHGGVKLILLAGPSSSGKTSTALRIALQCKVHGLNPRTIELDNYFKNREDTPKLPNGLYDFECLEAMDLELLNRHLRQMLKGEEVDLPTFDFKEGKQKFLGNKMKLEKNNVLIMEGIHALDPGMTAEIPEFLKYKIYVSDISSIAEYDTDFSASDCRLLRRMVRDGKTRGHDAEKTILQWPSVLEGEQKYIFPFQDNADACFNSTLQYELPLLKYFTQPLLRNIPPTSEAFGKASRLLNVLDNIDALPIEGILGIPVTSIMREFVGNQVLSKELL